MQSLHPLAVVLWPDLSSPSGLAGQRAIQVLYENSFPQMRTSSRNLTQRNHTRTRYLSVMWDSLGPE